MNNLKIYKNYNLAPRTTFKIGGPAKYYIEVKTKNDLVNSLDWAEKEKIDIFILGGGSNILIPDSGIEGVVIKNSNDKISVKGERIVCSAGANLMKAARVSISFELDGLVWGVGVPGTVGGAVRGNAGAYGETIADLVETVLCYDVQKKKFMVISKNDSDFSYKNSIFKKNSKLIIWEITLKLSKGEKKQLEETRDSYFKYRRTTQPKLPSAGCVFKNLFFEDVKKNSPKLAKKALSENVVNNGRISSAWIIESLGLKGKVIGGAKISLEHANFIVNTGPAVCDDILKLISLIKQQARDAYGISLREEIQYFGFK